MTASALWLAAALATAGSGDPAACRFRPGLDDAQAARLLLQTPAARRVRPHAVDVQPSAPSPTLPADRTFSGALVSRTPDDGALGNGLLGYYAVDRRSGEVTSLADFTPVRGAALARTRAALCRARR